MDLLQHVLPARPATVAQPLLGLTLLLVEDSRLASEGMRLMAVRSGARLRRADSLGAAERHLRTYRPGAIIVDLGLPDGSGLGLIARLAHARNRIDAILATSGDPALAHEAREAGADAFLPKPLPGLAAFQATLLALLPADRPAPAFRAPAPEPEVPDAVAFRDDLAYAADLLHEGGSRLDYVTRFLRGVARDAGDAPLSAAVEALAATRGAPPELAHIARLMRGRIARVAVA